MVLIPSSDSCPGSAGYGGSGSLTPSGRPGPCILGRSLGISALGEGRRIRWGSEYPKPQSPGQSQDKRLATKKEPKLPRVSFSQRTSAFINPGS